MSTANTANTDREVDSRLRKLSEHGQSIWLDFISRSFLAEGKLKDLVDLDGLRGVTSNPSIFEKAIAKSDDYAKQLEQLFKDPTLTANDIYERLAVEDIQEACDTLRYVYEETKGRDGYVSMEVSPLLASNTRDTVEEARRLWDTIDRPNLMIKVPGTPEGVPAIRELISEGKNVNVTLLFSRDAYKAVAEAYMEGLEELASKGEDLSGVASVASFFVSRIDSAVDKLLDQKASSTESERERTRATSMKGKTAIANAKLAYEIYRDMFTSERWKSLVEKGARPQRLLWASTSTKDPSFPDTLYVDELIGNETVNTLPLETLDAFRDHGNLADTLEANIDDARSVLESIEKLGVSLDQVTNELLEDGVRKFAESFRSLLDAVKERRRKARASMFESMSYSLPKSLGEAVKANLQEWDNDKKVERLWAKDSSVWTGKDEGRWLDWLTLVEAADAGQLKQFQRFVKESGFSDVLLLGMGGSSLCPEVMSITFGRQDGFPRLQILDSTNPAQVLARHQSINIEKTLFIVASKSGTTLEPNIFMSYFLEQVKSARGGDGAAAGKQFVAITDPGSKLEKFAKEHHFSHVFYGLPSVGGRYSALSAFGLVPSAAMGLDIDRLLESAEDMVAACKPSHPALENAGVLLGVIFGASAAAGRDKLTIVSSNGLSDLGAWLEQLVAESTGKEGKGIIPVDREPLAAPGAYGDDRLFVYLTLADEKSESIEQALKQLESAGHPVVRIELQDKYEVAREFFRFEIATAVAGSLLGINPFDQPDVEASKVATRALTDAFESAGSLPEEEAFFEEDGIKLYTDRNSLEFFESAVKDEKTLENFLKAHLSRVEKSDYFAILAYLNMSEENERVLENIRHAIRDSRKVATCLGFGPRFLHSTGQAYKGGPNSGVFLQVTSDHGEDLPVPDHKYSFGVVVDAQARGDFEVLSERGRRALRVHLGTNVGEGLKRIREIVSRVSS